MPGDVPPELQYLTQWELYERDMRRSIRRKDKRAIQILWRMMTDAARAQQADVPVDLWPENWFKGKTIMTDTKVRIATVLAYAGQMAQWARSAYMTRYRR
jgi:hypothetical protein